MNGALSYRGRLYRALNPVYAREPLSGWGAAHYRGRFNPKGTPALYTALSPVTALREASQVGSLQPTMLVSYDAEIGRVFDGHDESLLEREGMDPVALAATSWRDEMRTRGEARTQALARRLIAGGYHGLLVRSFAVGATEDDLNLALWTWGEAPPARLSLIDDEGRLSRS